MAELPANAEAYSGLAQMILMTKCDGETVDRLIQRLQVVYPNDFLAVGGVVFSAYSEAKPVEWSNDVMHSEATRSMVAEKLLSLFETAVPAAAAPAAAAAEEEEEEESEEEA
jgi:hypothetical protein